MEKKRAYPIILKKDDSGFYVVIPDFDIGTQGSSVVEAMEMARDAIGLMGIDMQDDGEQLPDPFSRAANVEDGDIQTLVDVDFDEYRKKVDNRAVKKNCTIPYWMSVQAEKANINYSKVLQESIVKQLGLVQNSI